MLHTAAPFTVAQQKPIYMYSFSNSISACCCEFVFIITLIWERNMRHQICKVNNLKSKQTQENTSRFQNKSSNPHSQGPHIHLIAAALAFLSQRNGQILNIKWAFELNGVGQY